METLEDLKAHFINEFDRVKTGLHAKPFYTKREEAIDIFAKNPLPNRYTEAWKYTSIFNLSRHRFPYSRPPIADFLVPNDEDYDSIVFLNGQFCKNLSTILNNQYIRLEKFFDEAAMIQNDSAQAFENLNTAFCEEGIKITIPANTILNKPIKILHKINANAYYPQKLQICIEEKAQVEIIESFESQACTYLLTGKTEIICASNSICRLYQLYQETQEAFHFHQTQIQQYENSETAIFVGLVQGKIIRNEIKINLLASGAKTAINAFYQVKKQDHHDLQVQISHLAPQTQSQTRSHGLVDEAGHAVFNGKIIVAKGAMQTTAHLQNKNILLSQQAAVDTKPELEIFADDVQCSHGATVGQLDPQALFYLQSRGIGLKEAQSILTEAFLETIISVIKNKTLKALFHKAIKNKECSDVKI